MPQTMFILCCACVFTCGRRVLDITPQLTQLCIVSTLDEKCLCQVSPYAGRWVPNAELLRRCTYVFAAEMVIDVIKHAVLGKFNEIRPGVYREFMKVRLVVLCNLLLGQLGAACIWWLPIRHQRRALSWSLPTCAMIVITGAVGSSLLEDSDQQAPQFAPAWLMSSCWQAIRAQSSTCL